MATLRNIVLYDGQCGLCNATIRFFSKRNHSNNFDFMPMQEKQAQKLMQMHGFEGLAPDSVVYLRGNHVYLRSEAAIRMLAHLGGAYRLGLILLLVPQNLRDSVYNLIAKNRYAWFNQKNKCSI